MINVIIACRDNNILQKTIQEKRSIFNQIRHIQAIWNKLINLPGKTPTPDHIGDIVKSPIGYNWYDSIFANNEKMLKSNTFSAPFIRSSLPPDTKIIHLRISFRMEKTGIDNQYELYFRKFVDG